MAGPLAPPLRLPRTASPAEPPTPAGGRLPAAAAAIG